MMRSYEREGFDPPAPVATLKVIHLNGDAAAEVPMMLDSGAAITILPAGILSQIGVEPTGEVDLRHFSGSVFTAKTVQVRLKLGKARFRGEYAIAYADVGLLGRDVLNSLVLELHGPSEMWGVRRR